jgi:branched-chain amino acid transport system permease protein
MGKPADMSEVLGQAVVQGLLIGAVYGLIALSLTLVFTVSGLLNFAHGDFLALAMYGAFLLYRSLHLDPYLSAPLFGLLFLVIGLPLFDWLVFPVLKAGLLPGAQLMLGLLFVFENGILVAFGGDDYSVPSFLSNKNAIVGSLSMPWNLVAGAVVAAVLSSLLYIMLRRSEYGRQVRAVTQNAEAAALMGIPVRRVQRLAFAIGIGLLGLVGPMLVSQFSLNPSMGLDLTLLALIVMVVGGIGSFVGSMVGGILIGVAESIGSLTLGGSVGAMIPYGLLIMALLILPRGLFGGKA